MSDREQELRPCPFCGSSDIDGRGWLSGDGGAGPQCMNCGATAEPQWWNTRAPEPGQAGELVDDLQFAKRKMEEFIKACKSPDKFCLECDMAQSSIDAIVALQQQGPVSISREDAELSVAALRKARFLDCADRVEQAIKQAGGD